MKKKKKKKLLMKALKDQFCFLLSKMNPDKTTKNSLRNALRNSVFFSHQKYFRQNSNIIIKKYEHFSHNINDFFPSSLEKIEELVFSTHFREKVTSLVKNVKKNFKILFHFFFFDDMSTGAFQKRNG